MDTEITQMAKEKIFLLATGLVLYLLSAGLSYASFSYFQPGLVGNKVSQKEKAGKFKVPVDKYAGLPRTESCPLNGTLYPKPMRDIWETRRPLGIMVENSRMARPQSGLGQADVIYEAVAEGGITRLLAVYYCQDAETIGPVRSARTYYLDWISEYGEFPLYAHVGGANTPGPADALGQIERYGWAGVNDLNQFSIGFPAFWRDYERLGKDTPTEHTVYSSTAKLWDFAAKKRQITDDWNKNFLPWSFKDDIALADRPGAFSTKFALSNAQASYADDYLVTWKYDRDSNSYLRFNGGVSHQDLNTGQQLLAKNVILAFMSMTVADDGYDEDGHGLHTLYGTKGSGKAKFLLDGKVTDGTWVKKTRLDRTRFYDTNGGEIKFNRGQIWIEVLPQGLAVTLNAQ